MKENPYDIVQEKALKRIETAVDKIAEDFKGVKPFDKEPVSNDELLNQYNQLTPEKLNELIQTQGREAVNEMIFKMEKLKARRK